MHFSSHCTQIDFHWDNCGIFYHRTTVRPSLFSLSLFLSLLFLSVCLSLSLFAVLCTWLQCNCTSSRVVGVAVLFGCFCVNHWYFGWSVAALLVTWEAFVIKHLIHKSRVQGKREKSKRKERRKTASLIIQEQNMSKTSLLTWTFVSREPAGRIEQKQGKDSHSNRLIERTATGTASWIHMQHHQLLSQVTWTLHSQVNWSIISHKRPPPSDQSKWQMDWLISMNESVLNLPCHRLMSFVLFACGSVTGTQRTKEQDCRLIHSFWTLCVCLSLSLSLSFFSFHSLSVSLLFVFLSRVISQSKDRTPYTHTHTHQHTDRQAQALTYRPGH